VTTEADLAKTAAKLAAVTARRNELVCQMRAEGATLRTIATAANLTAPGVARILKRESR
jgi:hypothetical protein